MEVRPFDFTKIPRVSRQEVQLLDSLRGLFPHLGFSDELGRAIRILIQRELGLPCVIQRERIEPAKALAKLETFSGEGVFLVFGLPPVEQKGVLEIDPFLARLVIDKLLGGGGGVTASASPSLTDIEEGVLAYLFLKFFALIFERCGASERVHFRMEGFRRLRSELSRLFRPGDGAVYLSFHVGLGQQSGFARLLLPNPLAQMAFLEPLEGAEADDSREMEYYLARLVNYGYVETEMWAELGRTTLAVRDINALEPGDVVRLETAQAHSESGRLAGELLLRVGRGEQGAFRGAILPGSGDLNVRIENLEL